MNIYVYVLVMSITLILNFLLFFLPFKIILICLNKLDLFHFIFLLTVFKTLWWVYILQFVLIALNSILTLHFLFCLFFLMPTIYFYYTVLMLKLDPENFIHFSALREQEEENIKMSRPVKEKNWAQDFTGFLPLFHFHYWQPYKNFFIRTKQQKAEQLENIRRVTLLSRKKLVENGKIYNEIKKNGFITNKIWFRLYILLIISDYFHLKEIKGSLQIISKKQQFGIYTNAAAYEKLTKESHSIKKEDVKRIPFFLRRRKVNTVWDKILNFLIAITSFLLFLKCFVI